jgi:hypothetical protein
MYLYTYNIYTCLYISVKSMRQLKPIIKRNLKQRRINLFPQVADSGMEFGLLRTSTPLIYDTST